MHSLIEIFKLALFVSDLLSRKQKPCVAALTSYGGSLSHASALQLIIGGIMPCKTAMPNQQLASTDVNTLHTDNPVCHMRAYITLQQTPLSLSQLG